VSNAFGVLLSSCEAPLTQELLLVDFENVQQVDLSSLNEETNVIIFVGANQKAIPLELVTTAQRLGQRVEWQRVEGNGSNTLDFHIACHLGRVLEPRSCSAPCKGAVSQWVQIPPGNYRSSR
jgi:hypothetical protein